jgi:hypothetical protein
LEDQRTNSFRRFSRKWNVKKQRLKNITKTEIIDRENTEKMSVVSVSMTLEKEGEMQSLGRNVYKEL